MLGFLGLVVILLFGMFALGKFVGDFSSSKRGTGEPFVIALVGVVVCALVIVIHWAAVGDSHVLFGEDKPNFYINENVSLPDGSIGRIDNVYYLIEGNIIVQDSLR
jgi:hypothetical protein